MTPLDFLLNAFQSAQSHNPPQATLSWIQEWFMHEDTDEPEGRNLFDNAVRQPDDLDVRRRIGMMLRALQRNPKFNEQLDVQMQLYLQHTRS